MALKINNDIVINDDLQIPVGNSTKNITTGNYDSAVSAFSGGGSILETGAAHYIKQTPPTVTYSSGRSNYLIFDQKSDRTKNLPNNFIMEIPGNSGISGLGKRFSQIGWYVPNGFGSGREAAKFDISPDGLHWYIGNDDEERILYYTNTVPWGVSTVSYNDDLSTTAQFRESAVSGRNIKQIRISEDGYWFYILEGSGTPYSLHQYSLSLPFDLGTATHDSTITNFQMNLPGSITDNIILFEWRRDGKEILVRGSSYTAILSLNIPWDFYSSSIEVQSYGNWTFSSSGSARIDPDYKNLRINYYDGLSNTGWMKTYRWKTPWHIGATYADTFEYKTKESTAGLLSFNDFKIRPGGHHVAFLFSYVLGDRLYKYDFTDSAGHVVPESFTFPPYVHFENGAVPDFPLTGETLYLEFMTPDSGDTYYAKELYRG
jgi:hypothetical protein